MQTGAKSVSVEPNEFASKVLKNIYAGGCSATRNLFQFLYFSYNLSPQDGEVFYAINKVVEDDIFCHKLLAKDIIMLGGVPDYKNEKNIFFSAGNMEYPRSIKQMLLAGVELKENYIIEIKKTLNKIKEKHINLDLLRIIEINKKNKQILQNLLK